MPHALGNEPSRFPEGCKSPTVHDLFADTIRGKQYCVLLLIHYYNINGVIIISYVACILDPSVYYTTRALTEQWFIVRLAYYKQQCL